MPHRNGALGSFVMPWEEVYSVQSTNSNLVLDFAAIYQCAIKPFKHCPQNRAVCIFLLDSVKEGPLPFSDAVCSNYTNGKRAIPDDSRSSFSEISPEALQAKFSNVGINNLMLPADALRHLIDFVALSKSTLNRLVKIYKQSTQDSAPLTFLVEVFRLSSDAKGNRQLTPDEIRLLQSFAVPDAPAASIAADSAAEESSSSDDGFDDEDIAWMEEYLPSKVSIKHSSFFGTPVTMNRQVLNLPHDFAPMLYMLKPALKGMPIDTFTYDDFIATTGVSQTTGKMPRGSLQCLKLTGPVDGIVATIQSQNFSEVCAAVLLMCGRITLKEADQVEKAIKKASHPKIDFIRSLSFDSRIPNVEVTIFLRVDPEIVYEQTNPDDDADLKTYVPRHKRR